MGRLDGKNFVGEMNPRGRATLPRQYLGAVVRHIGRADTVGSAPFGHGGLHAIGIVGVADSAAIPTGFVRAWVVAKQRWILEPLHAISVGIAIGGNGDQRQYGVDTVRIRWPTGLTTCLVFTGFRARIDFRFKNTIPVLATDEVIARRLVQFLCNRGGITP